MVRIGVVGCGGIARDNHLPAFAALPKRCKLVALCDVEIEKARALGAKFSVAQVFSDHRRLLEQSEIDAVVVATPNRFHLTPTIDALGAGKHVLCEKPLGRTFAEAAAMAKAAKAAGKVLQVGFQLRFSGPVRFLEDMIAAGRFGEIYYARAQALRRRGVPNWGVFIDKEKQGGGPLIDIGIHVLDLTLHLMGRPKALSVLGMTWDKLGTDPSIFNQFGDYDRSQFSVEDMAVGLIRFEGGASVVVETSFMANIEGNPYQTQLFGTRAGAILKPFADDALRVFTEENRQLLDLTPAHIPKTQPHIAAAEAFLDAVEGIRPTPIPAEHGLELNGIIDALYRSAASGHEERVESG
ncbi:MAG: Gfo/Idh/MocA family oxidoreductase [Fimbriimonas ginsengisoli]|uniref:Gfo/Idh/MocA family oxidoreductase n=1 Tax=Fimbriimonas ginsengisoli TaxID=1005039 RepID=A0A931LTX0_FIMGI|nr:Gfo/Idh/MocA family oxidoreductase [Fimbriimonas ginsengisoli]